MLNSKELLSERALRLPPPRHLATQPGIISFLYGFPDEASFPVEGIREAALQSLHENSSALLQYGPPAPLATFLRKMLNEDEGLDLKPENLIVTSGSTQAIMLVCRLLLDPGDYVIVEAPTFMGSLGTFVNNDANIASVPVDENGMQVDKLDALLTRMKQEGKRAKFIYTIPTFQNPTGVTMPLERRQQLLEIALKHNILILEDDAYHGILFEGEVPPWLWTLDKAGVVLHCGTFSKTLAAGLRLGWIGGAPELISKMASLKDDGGTSPFAGYIAARFAESGSLKSHIKTLNNIYRQKRDRMLAALERYMPEGVRWTVPQGGFFIWLELPERIDTAKMLPQVIAEGVNYLPGATCFANGGGQNTIRLAFSYIKLEQIEPGLRKLGEIINKNL